MKRRGTMTLGIAALALFAAACNGADDGGAIQLPDDNSPPPADGGGSVASSLTEWDISADPSTVAAGNITFEVSNDGSQPHEFLIVRTDLAPDSLPVENGVVPEDAEGVDFLSEIEEFPAGESKTLSTSLQAGSYVLICNIAGHYQQGMTTGFTVS